MPFDRPREAMLLQEASGIGPADADVEAGAQNGVPGIGPAHFHEARIGRALYDYFPFDPGS